MNFAAGHDNGELAVIEVTAKRPQAGPSIQNGRELRKARDLAMTFLKMHGYNHHDCSLVFGLSVSQVYARINKVKEYNRMAVRRERV